MSDVINLATMGLMMGALLAGPVFLMLVLLRD